MNKIIGIGLWAVFMGMAFAQTGWADSVDSAAVSSKLDAILNGQQTILQQLADIRQELEIVKIRATNK